MGCIISCRGTGRATRKTLCGKKYTASDVVEFFTGKITCVECLIRQDAMFTRDYKQVTVLAKYNRFGQFVANLPIEPFEFLKDCKYVGQIQMWDAATVKGAIKLGKIGAHGMGLAK